MANCERGFAESWLLVELVLVSAKVVVQLGDKLLIGAHG